MKTNKTIANGEADTLKVVKEIGNDPSIVWHLVEGVFGKWHESNYERVVKAITNPRIFTCDIMKDIAEDHSVSYWVSTTFDIDMFC